MHPTVAARRHPCCGNNERWERLIKVSFYLAYGIYIQSNSENQAKATVADAVLFLVLPQAIVDQPFHVSNNMLRMFGSILHPESCLERLLI